MKPRLLIFISFLFLAACSDNGLPDKKMSEKMPKPVSTILIGEINSYESRVFSGVIQSSDKTDLSFEVTGKVEAVHFKLGQGFEKGQPLAKLDQINYRLAVKEREGQLAEAKARLLEARSDFERKRALVQEGAVSRSQFDTSKSEFDTLKNQVDIAQARLGIAKEDLADTILKAPYKGTVAARFIEPSQTISPNTPAFTVQGDNGLEVSVLVPESLLSSLSVGKNADVKVKAVDMNFKAAVTELGTAAEKANSFPVVLKISSENTANVKSGMSAEVTFKLDRNIDSTQGVKLPVGAFIAGGSSGHFIFKVVPAEEKSGKQEYGMNEPSGFIVQKTPVQIVRLFDQHAVVRGDLRKGERIVDRGLAFLSDGKRVSPISKNVARYNP
ncbi:MAG: efflux RND transporter periplasmic adaptor subunit [Desulfobacterales bacterium]|nr:efflux RND transporter periplasmic adaptor subunit [Desulfobacterales bacterium]